MAYRLSKIYTRTGDNGTTGLGDGTRVEKDSPRVEAFGTVDELNSSIGVTLAVRNVPEAIRSILTEIQHELFDLGAELSVPGYEVITEEQVRHLEKKIDAANTDLPFLKEFILPSGGAGAATCHLARAICRRAERRVVSLNRMSPVNPHSLTYLNRLSDLLFVLARVLTQGTPAEWKNKKK